MEQLLQTVLNTLNTIHVVGMDDMQKMLGCMEALKQLIALASHPPDAEAETEEKGSDDLNG